MQKSFYLRPTVKVAKDLIGKFLVRKYRGKIYRGMITEVEAYRGFEDKACHASRGKTERNQVMFLKGGHAYVYLIYGIYYCLNIVTEKEGFPAAVLIRGLNYPNANGPGKLCREFKITKENANGLDITKDIMWVEDRGIKPKIQASKRIGVDYAGECAEWLWRFKAKG